MTYVDPRLTSNTNYFIYDRQPLTVMAEDWNGNSYGGERVERTCETEEEAANLLHQLQAPARAEAKEWARLLKEYQERDDI